MQTQLNVKYYDGSGGLKHIVNKDLQAGQSKIVITPEVRMNLSGNPYFILK